MHNVGVRRGWVVNATPGHLTRGPHYTGAWVDLGGQSGRVWKISPRPEFESPSVQPVAGRYSEYGIAVLLLNVEVELCRVKETCKYN